MNKKFKQGIYIPQNKQKYIHSSSKMNEKFEYPFYRSSWELNFFKFCDECEKITKWTSEPFAIEYFNILKNKICNYYPDALIEYNGEIYLIEIKPKSQIPGQSKKISQYDKLCQIVNNEKWKSADKFCKKNNYKFVILSDNFFINNNI